MKKLLSAAGMVLILLIVSGCSLIGLFSSADEIYFWSQFEEGEDTAEKQFSSQESFTFIMTRGLSEEAGGFSSQAEAESRFSTTVFLLEFEGSPQGSITAGEKYAKLLADDGWHICQDYRVTGLESGSEYTLHGKTTLTEGEPSIPADKRLSLLIR